jgi:hypothetical protein
MPGIRKLKAIRAIVRPDLRDEYLERWSNYAQAAKAAGVQVWLFEDQALPGRFIEFTEHQAAEGMEAVLDSVVERVDLRRSCVRREGDDVLYREVRLDG